MESWPLVAVGVRDAHIGLRLVLEEHINDSGSFWAALEGLVGLGVKVVFFIMDRILGK